MKRMSLLLSLAFFSCVSHSRETNVASQGDVSAAQLTELAAQAQFDIDLLAKTQKSLDALRASYSHETTPVSPPACPADMVEVEGDYCPAVAETCLQWECGDGTPGCEPNKRWPTSRCKEFAKPTKCLSKVREHKRFCIDKYEYPNVAGKLPESWMSWYDVRNACEAQGKRLCNKSEWTFACEGPDMQPYPYGDGYHRDKTACNFDNLIPSYNRLDDSREKRVLDKYLVPAGSMDRCVSPFGVYDQVGNIDEFVVNETGIPYRSALVGGHVFGVRNACRPMTEAHNEGFVWYETGGRCCSATSD